MAGRRDKTKQGSAILRSGQEDNPGSVQHGENQPRSNSNRGQTGGTASLKQAPSADTASNRNDGIVQGKVKSQRADERKFNLVVDDVPYLVKASPFSFNGELRFYITINDGDEHVFTWDSTIVRLRAIDDESGVLPEALEEAISRKLQA